MDTVAGGIQNPLTLNRYLYGHANPTSFIDPDGRRVTPLGPMIDGLRHQHAMRPRQSLSHAPPPASFRLAPRRASQPTRTANPAIPLLLDDTVAHRVMPSKPAVRKLDKALTSIPDSEYERFDRTLAFIHREMIDHADLPFVVAGRTPPSVSSALAANLGGSPMGMANTQTASWSAFAFMVLPDGPWDHKWQLEEQLGLEGDPDDPEERPDYFFAVRGNTTDELYYDVWSNIHYGYVGRAVGLSPDAVRLGHRVSSAGRHDAADRLSVAIGIGLWQAHGTQLTASHLHQAILTRIPQYRRIDDLFGTRTLVKLTLGEN